MRSIIDGVALAVFCAALNMVVAGQQLHLTPLTCSPSITSIGSCPDDGCGGLSDALLNDAKNRTDSPSSVPVMFHNSAEVFLARP